MELIISADWWQIINKLPSTNRTAPCETCHQAFHKLITSLHSKCYRPSEMLIQRQNSYAPHLQAAHQSPWNAEQWTSQQRKINKYNSVVRCVYRLCPRKIPHIHKHDSLVFAEFAIPFLRWLTLSVSKKTYQQTIAIKLGGGGHTLRLDTHTHTNVVPR
jgi:hypothetical protein